jgi:hypothetical protein
MRWPQFQARGRLASQGKLRSIHTINARIAARRGERGCNMCAWQKAQLHQTQNLVLRQFQPVENAVLPSTQLGK